MSTEEQEEEAAGEAAAEVEVVKEEKRTDYGMTNSARVVIKISDYAYAQGEHFINSFPLPVSISVSTERKSSAIAARKGIITNRIVSYGNNSLNAPDDELVPHCSRR